MGTSEKKEIFWAIIIGFAIGLVITFGVITANRAIRQKQQATPSPTSSPQSTSEAEAKNVLLEVKEPEDESVQSKEKITLSGSTTPNATVVIFHEEGEQILEATESGEFSTQITLVAGANQITVKAFTEEGNQAEKTISVVYSTSKI